MIQHFLPMLLCFTTLYGSDYFTSQSTCPEDDLRTRFENQWNTFSHKQIDSINAYTASFCYSQFLSSNPDFAHTIPQTIDAFIERGSSQIDAEKFILNQHNYYCSPSFREQIKTFSTYRSHIKELHSHLVANKGRCYQLRKALGFVHQGYQDLLAITETLRDEILSQEAAEVAARQEAHKRHAREKTQRFRQEEMVRTTFASQKNTLQDLSDEWRELADIYQDDDFVTESRFERRMQALQSMEDDGYVYETKAYTLSPQVAALLRATENDPQPYHSCYGNQLQQVIHQECIDGIEDLSILSTSSIAYPYKDGIAQCIDSARDYNQAGMIEQATTVSDFCWTFLDYGKAIAEGAVEGAIDAVTDIIEHPGHALLCVVAGEYVLAYQLSKVVYNVADIGITYLVDAERGKQKWDDYVAPVMQLIDAISNKEITLRDTIKGAAHLAVGWKAQEKLLGGLGKICKTAKTKALEYAKNNPLATPEQYMTTPEGIVFKAANNHQSPSGSGLKYERSSKFFIANQEEFFALAEQAQKTMKPAKEVSHALGRDSFNISEKFLTHIFAAELKQKNQFSRELQKSLAGFHHFMPGHLEEMGIKLLNTRTCKRTGIIIADVLCDGHLEKGKTFFPPSWSRNEVITKLGEAVKNPKYPPIVIGTRGIITGETSEGIVVRIVADLRSGDYITAYPDAQANHLL